MAGSFKHSADKRQPGRMARRQSRTAGFLFLVQRDRIMQLALIRCLPVVRGIGVQHIVLGCAAMLEQRVPMAEQEIIVCESRWPIARAGMGLANLPAGAILCLLAYKATAESLESVLLASLLSAMIAVIFGLLFYWTLSRISNEGGVITVVRSIGRVRFLEEDIVAARVLSIRPNHWSAAAIKLRNRKSPVLVHFIVLDHTNAGDFDATVNSLRTLLHAKRS
jgi:hypothetical protein